MGHLERGEKNVSFSSIVRVANALNVPISDLFNDLGADVSALAPKGRRRPRRDPALDRKKLAKEIAVLERTVHSLKKLANLPAKT